MKTVLLVFSFLPVLLWAQVRIDFEVDTVESIQFPEDRWHRSPEGAISGQYSLHHDFDNVEAGCDYYTIRLDPPAASDSLTFSFQVKHGYNPSASNNWQVALLADYSIENAISGDPCEKRGKIAGGLVLGVNFEGSDDLVRAWVCRNGIWRLICTTSLNYQEDVGPEGAPGFRLEWNRGGTCNIYCMMSTVGQPEEEIGSFELDSLPVGRHLVVRYQYTSSQDRKLWIDDIVLEGIFVKDTIRPRVTALEVLDGRHLNIRFSEVIATPALVSFQLFGAHEGIIIPDSLWMSEGGVVLEYPSIIPNRKALQLRVKGICDLDANCLNDTVLSFLRNEALWGDVVFNELMVDPSPPVLLPEEEYMELYNRSEYPLDLTRWSVRVGQQHHQLNGSAVKFISGLSNTAMLLEPASFALITGITLPNQGSLLALYSEKDILIHAATYAPPWEGPGWKMEGGWSIESPDPDRVCNISQLWAYSTDLRGGTPGAGNSNQHPVEDRDPPVFLYAGFGAQPGTVWLHYSEPVFYSPHVLEEMIIKPGNARPDSVVAGWPQADLQLLYLPSYLLDRKDIRIKLPAVSDCSGNISRPLEFMAGKTSGIGPGSLLINEIMYDPADGNPAYIELFHPGMDCIDLRELSLEMGSSGSDRPSVIPLSDHSRIVVPGQFLVISKNTKHLMQAYHLDLSGQWVEVKALKTMNQSGGTLALTDRNGMAVDRVFYENKMHADVIDHTRGVSLERISQWRPGSVSENWHSAASIEGYCTPGRRNSQSVGASDFSQLLVVEPGVFSPDNDGYQDLLKISISPGSHGWVISLSVTDLNGRLVRQVASSHLAGPVVTYTWNGEGDDGSPAREGIYILHARAYHPLTGEKWHRRVALGIIYR